ncbi:TetR/AcrR family transcriptional regulator [Dyadobacter arcticus]|uniref:AcrR family transcriptional regulator n=1 Tax=Dyadobacter arcticus TaxID=1078754 RepID=A0ABX0UIF7_9BACT|nr:TetR/AcrR family transcriptional regulator [Dyadobacter arcticus]NIJ52802.1 AcrR family transcriptional regulator [Dyadobacter arcticus]
MNVTQQRILGKALEMFNLKGIEYVGMRELAAELGLRIGNLTYYFPTKDDLVYALTELYSASNSEIHKAYPVKSLYDFLKKNEALFKNGLRYRSLLLSMVHLIERNPKIAANYEGVRSARLAGLNGDTTVLAKNNYLKFKSEAEQLLLASTNSLQNRFWMSEAVLSGSRQELDGQMNHYLSLKAFLFTPYATQAGLNDIERFLQELQ